MKTNIFIGIFILIICFSGTSFANPIVVGPSFNGQFFTNTGRALMIDFAADFVALILGYMIVRNIRAIIAWKFIPYFLIVFIGGVIIDALSIVPVIFFSVFISEDAVNNLMFFLVAGLFLYLYNSFMAKRFFELENIHAAVIGLIMAILTNPVIGLLVKDNI